MHHVLLCSTVNLKSSELRTNENRGPLIAKVLGELQTCDRECNFITNSPRTHGAWESSERTEQREGNYSSVDMHSLLCKVFEASWLKGACWATKFSDVWGCEYFMVV
jgi:hypothetical protein